METENSGSSAPLLEKDQVIEYAAELKKYKEADSKKITTILGLLVKGNLNIGLIKDTKLHKLVPTLKNIAADESFEAKTMQLSKDLLKKMKSAYESEKGEKKAAEKSASNEEEKSTNTTSNHSKKEEEPSEERPASKRATLKREYTSLPTLSPSYRNGILNFFSKTLQADGDKVLAMSLSVEIEEELFSKAKGDEKGYKNTARKKLEFIGNKNNKELREQILTGEISPEKFVESTEKDLMSEKLREKLENIEKETMEARFSNWAQLNAKGGGMYCCRKCKSSKTHTSQQQTRSADEPMTTFVTCLECGASYKF